MWPSSGPWKLCPFLLPKHLPLEQMAWKSSLHCYRHPLFCPTWILRSKTRPISVVSSSPWAKVKGFALRAAENTGLAWELTGLASTRHQCFRFSSYWFSVMKHSRKRDRNWLCGAGHLFWSFYLAAFFFSIPHPLWQSNRNKGLLVKTFHLLYFSLKV